MNSNTVAVGVLKAVASIVAAGVVVVGCMAYFGSQPDGSTFVAPCRAEVPLSQIKNCVAAMEATYIGPRDADAMRNAAALWERDRQEVSKPAKGG